MMCNSDSESIGPGVAHICLHLYEETATDRIGHEYMQRHHKQGDRNCCVLHRNSNRCSSLVCKILHYPKGAYKNVIAIYVCLPLFTVQC